MAIGDIRNAPGQALSKTGDYRSLDGAGTFRDSGPDKTRWRDLLVILVFVRFIPVSSLSCICPLVNNGVWLWF